MKVLITDKINQSAGEIIKEVAEPVFLPTMSEDELCKVIGEYDALMVRSQTKVTEKVLQAGKNLKIVGRAGVGVDNVNIDVATQNGVIVVNSPDGNTTAAAEHTIALMLSVARNIPEANKTTKDGQWNRSQYTGVELLNKNLGLIGFGKIGSHVAQIALAIGMKVFVYDPYTSKEIIEKFSCSKVEALDEIWSVADFITVHVPKTKETINLINKDAMKKMKNSVCLINCARGGIINEKDLQEALDEKLIKGAAIDVYENEPDIKSSPLYECKGNLILTPHLGASTTEAQLNVATDVAEQIRDVLSAKTAKSAVNIPSLKSALLEPVKKYMKLAENLGEFVKQITDGTIKSVEIKSYGQLSEVDISPLVTAILKGIFSTFTEGVNYVNAPFIAKKKGIDIISSKSQKAGNFIGALKIKLVTDKAENVVSGALITENIPRILSINNYETSIKPENNILLVPHENKPSMIAKVATVIGESNINISFMNVAQKVGDNDDESIMIINTEAPVNEETVEKISQINGVRNPKYVHLNA